jgi:hypothetical protein
MSSSTRARRVRPEPRLAPLPDVCGFGSGARKRPSAQSPR